MGKFLKRGFKTEKQKSRLENISRSSKQRLDCSRRPLKKNIVIDHTYCNVSHASNETQNEGVENWRGRRIVDLGVLADALAGCASCGNPLHLIRTTDITTFGLSSMLKIPCTNCQMINNVPTGKRHGRVWDANTKLATALVHTGLGGRQVNGLLAALNIPPVSNKTLYDRARESGPVMEAIAEESMTEAIIEEIAQTKQKTGDENLTVNVDGAWQKRGSGRSYDSLSGHCSMIGAETGKILDFSVRSKYCRTCDIAAHNSRSPKDHDCRMNWDGSSKSMEQDMVVQMLSDCKDKGLSVSTIVGDDDSTTISRVRKTINPAIKKKSDRNHIKKTISNRLYSLQKKHQSCSGKIVAYLKDCLSMIIAQNNNNAEGISEGLDALSQHPFGNHTKCNSSWCRHKDDPKRKFRSLPYGKPLTDKKLQEDLIDLLENFKVNADKLSNLGSTQANESFNNSVASKAPKSHFYSGSASLNYRVSAAVAQKNYGHSYVEKIHQKLKLSPGTFTTKLAKLRDLQSKKKKAISRTWQFKRRRRELKALKIQKNSEKEIREGTSYSPGVDLDASSSDTDTIPKPIVTPAYELCCLSFPLEPIYFDLETTGLARSSHITQIAAKYQDEEWSSYVLPKKSISKQASLTTGITFKNGKLFHHGKLVDAVSISSAINSFLSFIKSTKCVYLAGHNIKTFDCHILFHALESCQKTDHFIQTCQIAGFIDTRLLFRLCKPDMKRYSQQHIYSTIFKKDFAAHDAMEDVKALKLCVDYINYEVSHVQKASFTVESAERNFVFCKERSRNLATLKSLIEEKVVSKDIANKIAGSGLKLSHLKLAYKRGGVDGIKSIFQEKCGLGVRVTKSSKIISSVCRYFDPEDKENIHASGDLVFCNQILEAEV